MPRLGPGCCMFCLRSSSRLFFAVFFLSVFVHGQDGSLRKTISRPSDPGSPTAAKPAAQPAEPIPANAPPISRQTRYEIIRDFETQLVYARTPFPMGKKGLLLKEGVITPRGEDIRQALALYGPAVRPGEPAQISYVRIKDDHIHFELNGGSIRRKKWYQKVEISGANGASVPTSPNEPQDNPHGSYVDLYFAKYVPEMNAKQ